MQTGTITGTLIQGLTQQMVQTRLNTADAKPFLFGTHFPVKRVNGFTWLTLQNQVGKAHVAADLHADNATIVRKRRPIFESAKGDIPYIAISRELSRSELKDYQTALAFAKDADATALVQYWGADVDYCFDGVNSELEFIAWQLLSKAGKLHFTTANNATFANDFDLDYDVDEANKVKASTDWNNSSSADVIGDLVKIINIAKGGGLSPKFAFVSLAEFYKICSSEQIIKACASYLANAVGISQTPDLPAVNSMLAKQAWLNGIQLKVIDQTITRELQDGSEPVSGNPFDDDVLVLAESETLGHTQYDILAEDNPSVIRAERSHVVIKKYGTSEPTTEVTIGQADAIPVLDTAYRNVYVKTGSSGWS